MAYTPKTWVCGETITDTGLNNIEEGIQEALAGGGSSLPEVTSADDGKVLTVVDGEWEKADKDFVCDDDGNVTTSECFEKAVESLLGYECTEGRSTFIDTSITTTSSGMIASGSFPNGTPFPFEVGQTVFVTFNGTEHELVVRKSVPDAPVSELLIGNLGIDGFEIAYGINTPSDPPVLRTMLADTYTVKIETLEITATTTDCFEAAVKATSGVKIYGLAGEYYINSANVTYILPSENITVAANSVTQLTFAPQTWSSDGDEELMGVSISRIKMIKADAYSNLVLVDFYTEPNDSTNKIDVKVRVRNMSSQSITLTRGDIIVYALKHRMVSGQSICVIPSSNCE